MLHNENILILDFGSQYTQLIARRIRENHVFCEIHPGTISIDKIKNIDPVGIILSGGPTSVYDDDAPKVVPQIFEMGLPILGICYGQQLITDYFGGQIKPAAEREYGRSKLEIKNESPILEGVSSESIVWMSHGDVIVKLPAQFETNAISGNTSHCVISNSQKNIFAVQFHPEVAHTDEGIKIIRNFIFNICKCSGSWTPKNFIENTISDIKNKVGDKKAICALSGGVDSSVAAVLLQKAIGDNLICVHVDSGLMRKDESKNIVKMFEENYNLKIIHIDATEKFLTGLENISDPEIKRKIIGNAFIEVFESEAKNHGEINFLIQGTLYPDVIESVSVKGKSVTIKTHHNVGGLPEKLNFKLIEPFRELFKDEVRAIGKELGMPQEFIGRHPFPGPGLAVRILGEITSERLDILREVDDIYISEIQNAGIYDEIWQAFAVLLPVKTVGVMGDYRTYENVIALRAVTSTDGMTADWYSFESEFLRKVSNKIIQSVRGVNRVVLDISSKPPATIEWE